MRQPAHTLSVFDLDDTLAEGSENLIRPAYANFLYNEIVTNNLPGLTRIEFNKLQAVYNAYGLGSYRWAEVLGHPSSWAEDLHQQMASVLAQAFVKGSSQASQEIKRRLAELENEGHMLAILTHGHLEYAVPVVEHLGLSRFFPLDTIFDITTNGGTLKSSVATYRHVVAVMEVRNGARFRHLNMVEDNPKNLIAAKQAGFTTYMVGNGVHYTHPDQHLVVDRFHDALETVFPRLLEHVPT